MPITAPSLVTVALPFPRTSTEPVISPLSALAKLASPPRLVLEFEFAFSLTVVTTRVVASVRLEDEEAIAFSLANALDSTETLPLMRPAFVTAAAVSPEAETLTNVCSSRPIRAPAALTIAALPPVDSFC
ncbi:MAG: hypothetical protein KJ703_09690, partial [Alphaproteobacteria bacterium]|nr:hypothetical protein [Alphaproteobacteria bacterium]